MSAPRHLSNVEQVLYSTCRIEIDGESGHSEGTGFFVGFNRSADRMAVALVSCRHVLEGAKSVRFWLPIEDDAGNPSSRLVDVTVKVENGITLHPDSSVDLARFIMHHVEKYVLGPKDRLFYRVLPVDLIPVDEGWRDICCGDDVYVIGCPLGIVDGRRKSPIVRKGVISSLDRESDSSSFLIDVPTLDGSSGSPVVVDSHLTFDARAGQYLHESRFHLAGIVATGIEDHSDDFPRDAHLGRVIKADRLHELFSAILQQYGLDQHFASRSPAG